MRLELGQATTRKPPFKYSAFTRVGFSDTDARGHRLLRPLPAVLRPGAGRVPPSPGPARQTVVLIDRATRRAEPIGDAFRQRIREFEGDDVEVASLR